MPNDLLSQKNPLACKLSERLSNLPLTAPNHDELPFLINAMKQRKEIKRKPYQYFALAASIGLISLAVFLSSSKKPETIATQSPGIESNNKEHAQINKLIAQNQFYESNLHRVGTHALNQTAQTALASAELEDLIGMIDLQLSATSTTHEAQDLWQKRTQLMRELIQLQTHDNNTNLQLAVY